MGVLVVLALLSWSSQGDATALDPADAIDRAAERRMAGLYHEAKVLLVEALENQAGRRIEDEIRYELGVTLYFEGEEELAIQQWQRLLDSFPESPYAARIRHFFVAVYEGWRTDRLLGRGDFLFRRYFDLGLMM